MVIVRSLAAAVLALPWLAPPFVLGAPKSSVVELVMPRAASSREAVDLSVQVGAIAKGTEIDITTPSGELIGTVSPFAIRPGQPAGTYVFPLHEGAIENGRVVVAMSLRRAGEAARAPTPEEVIKVSIVFTAVTP
jgi:hypothetical protein